jgi:hypothetical protein
VHAVPALGLQSRVVHGQNVDALGLSDLRRILGVFPAGCVDVVAWRLLVAGCCWTDPEKWSASGAGFGKRKPFVYTILRRGEGIGC